MEQAAETQNLGSYIDRSDSEMWRHARLGDILVAARFVTREALEKAVESQEKERRLRLGRLLLEQRLISEDQLLAALSMKFRMTFVDLDKVKPAPEAVKALPRDLVNQMQVFPFAFAGKTLIVATSQPADATIFDRLRFSTSYAVELVAARANQISAKINQHYNAQDSIDTIIDQLRHEQDATVTGPAQVKSVEPDSKVIRLVNSILMDAQRRGASDIHFESGSSNHPMKLRYRVDGDCFLANEIPASYNNPVIARLKIISNLDIAERRKPQSGKIMLRFDDREMEYRVEITPTVGGHEDAVLRVLTASKPLPLEEMGFTRPNFIRFSKMLTTPHGLILCVGPTGSGKTTTLHSALACINEPQRKIWSAEDPVEIVQEGLRQVQVNPKIGFTFQEALKSFMRADPDVIMIGEIRDRETAETAISAALSGHLVFSTLHTNSAIETVTRLVEMGIEPYFFVDALVGVLAQRLARKLCLACKESYHPTEEEYLELIRTFGGELARKHRLPPFSASLTLMRKRGCDKCLGSGYKGRIAIHELISADHVFKEAIKAKANVETLRRIALQEGMLTLKMDGILKVFQGITDLAQVMRVCLE
jgi:type II secretory ATPase GspE/PulE/Tfp pilus assembly ATPase PilB-like protein